MSGMLPRTGTCCSDSVREWSMSPPSTTISPVLASTLVVISRSSVTGWPPMLVAVRFDTFWSIFELHRIALVDLRRDLEGDAHVLTVHGLEGVDDRAAGGGGGAGGGAGVLAGDERHFLGDLDGGFLVVQGHHARGGQDVGLAVAREGAQQRRDAEAGAGDLAQAERQACGVEP